MICEKSSLHKYVERKEILDISPTRITTKSEAKYSYTDSECFVQKLKYFVTTSNSLFAMCVSPLVLLIRRVTVHP